MGQQQQQQRQWRAFLKLILLSSLGVLGVLLTLALSLVKALIHPRKWTRFDLYHRYPL
jgi:hypothetical protein